MDKRDSLSQPVQPAADDGNGVLRFKENSIVRYLLDAGGLDLNDIAIAKSDAPKEDWQQFHQLIGYSVSGPSRRLFTSHNQS